MSREKELLSNWEAVRNEVAPANLIAVSKTFPTEEIECLYHAGQRDFGENKVQELMQKAQDLSRVCPDIRWHFVGNIQTNKIGRLLTTPNLFAVHSISSLKVLDKFFQFHSKLRSEFLHFFFQMNTSMEFEKSGFENYEELVQAVRAFRNQKRNTRFELRGLMTMSRLRTDNFEQSAEECFSKLVNFQKNLVQDFQLEELELSMGMSQDHQVAKKYQSDWVRIGTQIFGARQSED